MLASPLIKFSPPPVNLSSPSRPSVASSRAMPTFADHYCARHAIPAEKFERAVLRRALYPQARLLFPLIDAIYPGFFDADSELVRTVGGLAHLRRFQEVCVDYRHHLAHTSAARRFLRLRLSVRALYKLTARTFDDVDGGTPSPVLLKRSANNRDA